MANTHLILKRIANLPVIEMFNIQLSQIAEEIRSILPLAILTRNGVVIS